MLVVALVLLGLMLACYLRARMTIAANAPPGESAPAAAARWWWVVAAGLTGLACLTCLLAR